MALNDKMFDEWWIEKSVKGSGHWGTILTIVWRDWGKLWKTSARIVNVLAEIQTKYPLNKSLEDYCYTNQVSAVRKCTYMSVHSHLSQLSLTSTSIYIHRFKDKFWAEIFSIFFLILL
jgi:hypothetical protein